MQKSLLLTNDFPPITSGIATYFFQLWRHLPSGSVTILAPSMQGSQHIDNQLSCQVIRKRIPVGESGTAKILKMLIIAFWACLYVPKHKIDMLHCGQVLSTGLVGLVCRWMFKTRYIVFVCGSESIRFGRLPILRTLMKKILFSADKLIANSESTRQEYVEAGIPQEWIAVITPGVDSDFFTPASEGNFFREKYNLDSNPTLLTVSRLDERKGHDRVLQALARIHTFFPDLKYLIAGTGREETRLKKLVRELGLSDKVIFTGFVPDDRLPELYNAGDIFILPNRETQEHAQLRGDIEGFGIVFLEAASCGKPSIAGNNGGAAEAVAHRATGLLVNSHDTEDIENAIVTLLKDSALAKTLGQNGRQRCLVQFQWQHLAGKLEAEIL